MKKFTNLIGIVLAAVIGFSMAACEKKADQKEGEAVDWESINTDRVIEGNGIFVATGVTLGVTTEGWENRIVRIAYSRDGKTWKAANTPFPTHALGPDNDYYITAIAYGNKKFVASGWQSTGAAYRAKNFIMAYSKDGINWTAANIPTLPEDNFFPESIAFDNGKFLMLGSSFEGFGEDGPESVGRILVSTDGINWTNEKTTPSVSGRTGPDGVDRTGEEAMPPAAAPAEWVPSGAAGIAGNGIFVTADNEGRMAYSHDGKTWSAATNTPFPTQVNYRIRHITYGNDRFVASGLQFMGQDSPPGGFMLAYSPDGINWTKANCPLPDNTQINGIAYGNGRFVMISSDNIAVSTDGGANWTPTDKPFNNTNDTRITFRSITFEQAGEEVLFRVVFQKWETAEWGGWVSKESDISTMISSDGVDWTVE